jgi:hypothetical protein
MWIEGSVGSWWSGGMGGVVVSTLAMSYHIDARQQILSARFF